MEFEQCSLSVHSRTAAKRACCSNFAMESPASLDSDASCCTGDEAELKRLRHDLQGVRASGMFPHNSRRLSTTSSVCTSGGLSSELDSVPSSRQSSFSSCCSPFSPAASQPEQQPAQTDIEQCRLREAFYTPQNIFKRQAHVNPAMREMLVEWMCEVVIQYRMHLETFLLAVNYVDRYLCKVPVLKPRFQLLGLTCLWIASKYEEVHPPSVKQLLEMADNAYGKCDMMALESEVLHVLEWQLTPATTLKFMHLYLVNCQATSYTVQAVGECMLQLASLDYALCAEQPAARVAAAAACVALTTCQLTHLVPQVMAASGWNNAAALAQLSHDLYAHFSRLSAPGMPFHPIIAHYAQRQRAINRHATLDNSVSQVMVPTAAYPPATYQAGPAVSRLAMASGPVTAVPGVQAELYERAAAKAASAYSTYHASSAMMDCTAASDQTHKIRAVDAVRFAQQQQQQLLQLQQVMRFVY